jgi:hypothetical protein
MNGVSPSPPIHQRDYAASFPHINEEERDKVGASSDPFKVGKRVSIATVFSMGVSEIQKQRGTDLSKGILQQIESRRDLEQDQLIKEREEAYKVDICSPENMRKLLDFHSTRRATYTKDILSGYNSSTEITDRGSFIKNIIEPYLADLSVVIKHVEEGMKEVCI